MLTDSVTLQNSSVQNAFCLSEFLLASLWFVYVTSTQFVIYFIYYCIPLALSTVVCKNTQI